jgi:hypothetical protein
MFKEYACPTSSPNEKPECKKSVVFSVATGWKKIHILHNIMKQVRIDEPINDRVYISLNRQTL